MPRLVHVAVVFAILWINACAASGPETKREANTPSSHRNKYHFAENAAQDRSHAANTAAQKVSHLTEIKAKAKAERGAKSFHGTPRSDSPEKTTKPAILEHAHYAGKTKHDSHLAMGLEKDDHEASGHNNPQNAQPSGTNQNHNAGNIAQTVQSKEQGNTEKHTSSDSEIVQTTAANKTILVTEKKVQHQKDDEEKPDQQTTAQIAKHNPTSNKAAPTPAINDNEIQELMNDVKSKLSLAEESYKTVLIPYEKATHIKKRANEFVKRLKDLLPKATDAVKQNITSTIKKVEAVLNENEEELTSATEMFEEANENIKLARSSFAEAQKESDKDKAKKKFKEVEEFIDEVESAEQKVNKFDKVLKEKTLDNMHKQAETDIFSQVKNSKNITPTLTFSDEETTEDSASPHSQTSHSSGEGSDPASHITAPATADIFSDLPPPDFQPMRIAAFTRSLYVDAKYCESSRGTKWDARRDFWNNEIFCSTDDENPNRSDTFTEEKRNVIKNTILPAVIRSFSSHPLRYRVPGDKLKIPYLRYGNRCQHFMFPDSHWSYGVHDADVVLYVGAMPMNKSIDPNPVRAEPCTSIDGRVVAVALNFNPKHILDGQTVIDAAIKDVSKAIGAAKCPNKTSVIMTQQYNRLGKVYSHCAAAYFNTSKQSMRMYDEKARQWFECSKKYVEKRWTRTGPFNCQLAEAPKININIVEKQTKSTDSVGTEKAEEHAVTEMSGFMVRMVNKDAVGRKMRHAPATESASANFIGFSTALLVLSSALLVLSA